ncbi:MAG: DNA-protecting protein DprA [Clostridiales bacterium]|nr:DNA-protecting protein DprA [Clostridiales bacterium]
MEKITSGQPQYPALLKEIRDYPKELFYIGNVKLLQERCVSVVGSRTTTQYGRSMAFAISKRLAQRRITVVSGMARGIDSCAHQGALRADGGTIAVLGCGGDICYPKENTQLKKQIEERGLILSEYPPGTPPEKYYFPQRNRIISGLSEITVVVQARNNSGSLITADLAAEQGREVYALPGNIDSEYNLGSNKLIKEGAVPLISVEDIGEGLGLRGFSSQELESILSTSERQIYELLEDHGEMSVDDICFFAGKKPSYINSMVAVMEMKGIVFSALGKIFIAKE